MGEARTRNARGFARIAERNDELLLTLCDAATRSGGAQPFSAVAVGVGGITGSTGYALATGIPVIHADSDLDLLIRAPHPVSPDAFAAWQAQLSRALCRGRHAGGYARGRLCAGGMAARRQNAAENPPRATSGDGPVAQGRRDENTVYFSGAGHTA